MKLIRYKFFCTTENTWKEWFLPESLSSPINCPFNDNHVISLSTITKWDNTRDVIHYKVYCINENTWKEWFLSANSPIPTQCPGNSSHKIDVTKTAIVELDAVVDV